MSEKRGATNDRMPAGILRSQQARPGDALRPGERRQVGVSDAMKELISNWRWSVADHTLRALYPWPRKTR